MLPCVTSYEHFTDEHRGHISIVSNTLYRHKTLELTYTAYDMQQDKDKIRQCKYSGVMVLADDERHPYLYGQVLDLFHVRVKNNGPHTLLLGGSEAILPMVWVRWFKLDRIPEQLGFHSLRYPSVSFYKSNETDAFGLIHPDEIIRAIYLIPQFKFGCTHEYLDVPSEGQPEAEEGDWKHFNVNMYVDHILPVTSVSHPSNPLSLADRDTFMRFRGGGVGHMYMHHIEPWLDGTGWGTSWPSLQDRDPDPDHDPPVPNGDRRNIGPVTTTHQNQPNREEEDIEDSESDNDAEMSDMEDGMEGDPEQIDEGDDEGNEDEDEGDELNGPRDEEDEDGDEEDNHYL